MHYKERHQRHSKTEYRNTKSDLGYIFYTTAYIYSERNNSINSFFVEQI